MDGSAAQITPFPVDQLDNDICPARRRSVLHDQPEAKAGKQSARESREQCVLGKRHVGLEKGLAEAYHSRRDRRSVERAHGEPPLQHYKADDEQRYVDRHDDEADRYRSDQIYYVDKSGHSSGGNTRRLYENKESRPV